MNISRHVLTMALVAASWVAGVGDSDATAASPDAVGTSAKQVRFIQGYHKGYYQAKRQGKPMLILFAADWCPFCHEMLEETFTQQKVVSLSDRFVCVLVDVDKEEKVCELFQIEGSYPTIQFVSSRRIQLKRLSGKKSADTLLREMHAALEQSARKAKAGDANQRKSR